MITTALLAVLAYSLAAGGARAEGVQIMSIRPGQKITVGRSGVLLANCTQRADLPPRGLDRFQTFSGGVRVTRNAGGSSESKGPDGAVKARRARLVGDGAGRVRVEVPEPDPKVTYTIEVLEPTVAVPANHGLTPEQLGARLKGFEAARAEVAKADEFRKEFRDKYPANPATVRALDVSIRQSLYWGGRGDEFPWGTDPKEIAERLHALRAAVAKPSFASAAKMIEEARRDLERQFGPRSPGTLGFDLSVYGLFLAEKDGKYSRESPGDELGKSFGALTESVKRAREIRKGLLDRSRSSPAIVGEYELAVGGHFMEAGLKGQLPREGSADWATRALTGPFRAGDRPEAAYLRASLLAGSALNEEQARFLNRHLDAFEARRAPLEEMRKRIREGGWVPRQKGDVELPRPPVGRPAGRSPIG